MDLREVPQQEFRRHPWEVARARFFGDVANRQGPADRPLLVLDVGAGDGYLARSLLTRLPGGSQVVCFDPMYSDQHLARAAAAPTPGLSFARERPDRRFDLVLLLDVVEHVPDDRAFLSEIVANALAPGGSALVSVPAWMSLFSGHDLALGHHRRYRPAELRSLMDAAGLALARSGGLFHSLLLPRALAKAGELARGKRVRPDPDRVAVQADTELGRWTAGKALTGLVEMALRLDNRISQVTAAAGLGLPGLSIWALGRKR